MYVRGDDTHRDIIAPDFSVRVTDQGYMFMMVELKYNLRSGDLVLPTAEIRLRWQYYFVTSPKIKYHVHTLTLTIQNLISNHTTWTVPDFARQCEIMNLLHEMLY